MSAALSGTRIERNTIISSRNDIATTAAMKSGSRLVMRSVRSVTIAWPVSDTCGVGARRRRPGSTSERRWRTSCVGALVLRRRGRVDGEHRGVAGGVEHRRGDGGDAGIGLQRVVDAVDGGLVGRRRDLDDDLDRAVEPGAEAVGELVVGDALGRVGRRRCRRRACRCAC